MDEPPKKRRFWQLHLSTAIIMSVALGFVMLINIGRPSATFGLYDGIQSWYGWPLPIYVTDYFYHCPNGGKHSFTYFHSEHSTALPVDAVSGLLFLYFAFRVSQYPIRRREGRKQ
jgi:hypothetical protein